MKVCHFLSARWAEDDLARQRLKISRFDDLNDPFELLSPNLKDPAIRQSFLATRLHVFASGGFVLQPKVAQPFVVEPLRRQAQVGGE